MKCEELDFLLKRKFKNIRNGYHYVLGETVKFDKYNRPVPQEDAHIVEWRLDDKFPRPTQEDIDRLYDIFGDEMESNLNYGDRNMKQIKEPEVEDLGI